MTFNPNMVHMGDRPLKVGDVVSDNDPRTAARKGTVVRVDSVYAYIDKGRKTPLRVLLCRIFTDDKVRRTGYSLVVKP